MPQQIVLESRIFFNESVNDLFMNRTKLVRAAENVTLWTLSTLIIN